MPVPPEQNLIEWAKQLLVPGKMFVDVGAHVGSWSLQYAAMGFQVRAFEPQLDPYTLLKAAMTINDLHELITVYAEAMSDGNETWGVMSVVSEDGGGSSIVDLSTHATPLRVENVRVGRLDEYLDHRAGLIKIDVEGAEARVIRGAREGLKRAGYPKILLESWRPERMLEAGRLRTEVFEELKALGYRVIPLAHYDEMFLAEHD